VGRAILPISELRGAATTQRAISTEKLAGAERGTTSKFGALSLRNEARAARTADAGAAKVAASEEKLAAADGSSIRLASTDRYGSQLQAWRSSAGPKKPRHSKL